MAAANFGRKAQDADDIIRQIEAGGYDMASYERKARNAEIPLVGGKPNAKPEDRMYEAAEKEFIAAVLRKESGAAISPSEYDQYSVIYFPQPDDDKQTLEMKAARRKAVSDNLILMAGDKAAKQIPNVKFEYKPTPKKIPKDAATAAPSPGFAGPPPTWRDPKQMTQEERDVEAEELRRAMGG